MEGGRDKLKNAVKQAAEACKGESKNKMNAAEMKSGRWSSEMKSRNATRFEYREPDGGEAAGKRAAHSENEAAGGTGQECAEKEEMGKGPAQAVEVGC